MKEQNIPTGFMQNSQGYLVPNELVKPIDMERHDLVMDVINNALNVQNQLREFKDFVHENVAAFVELSAEQYEVKLGGVKGNVSLMTFDGKYKIQRSVAEHVSFDERLQVAKELVDKCINRWAEGARSEIKVLVQDAFQTDKAGKISTSRVLGLKRLDIQDEEWLQAMQAITDSIQVTGSKTYVRIYERVGDSDQWKPIPLDIAAL